MSTLPDLRTTEQPPAGNERSISTCHGRFSVYNGRSVGDGPPVDDEGNEMTKTKTKRKGDRARRYWIPKSPPASAQAIAVTDARLEGAKVLGSAGMFVLVDMAIGSWVEFHGKRETFEGRVIEIVREPGRRARVIIEKRDGSRRRVLKDRCELAIDLAN